MLHAAVFAMAPLVLAVLGTFSAEPKAGSIEVVIQGVRNNNGRLRVALFKEPLGFPENSENAFRKADAPATQGAQSTIVLSDVPPGSYAVAIFQDENNNGKLDKNLVGKPTEGYGVSNNAKHLFHAPSFEEARFDFDGKSKVVEIKLVY